ncbi:MAG TPA: Mut7-C RNAse domain-containing protein [Candidatus Omnitrophota bacterium]|nr:Mut7-C RNAse domain-containing protein [Candidatus Omnitrophota bacterium]HQO37337.1 Mut7-C RNAse domain-containing protein [Candidatus Omnitrophota bacterium]HQQ05782.1 Mut7-C RNAse domain-containing protein [Candidatus Omnitrophota bacterium]
MKFLLTKELGRLAKWLRICGYDAEYFTDNKPGAVIVAALKSDRMILTRNHHMPRGRGVAIMQVRAEEVQEQLIEVCRNLHMSPVPSDMFSRCTLCNEALQIVDKASIKERVPAYVFETQDRFFSCARCNRIYWQGTHWQSVAEALRSVAAN